MNNLLDTDRYRLLSGWVRITLTNGPYEIYLAKLSRDAIYYSMGYESETICEDIIETNKHFTSVIDFARDLINRVSYIDYKWECYHMEKKLNNFILK